MGSMKIRALIVIGGIIVAVVLFLINPVWGIVAGSVFAFFLVVAVVLGRVRQRSNDVNIRITLEDEDKPRTSKRASGRSPLDPRPSNRIPTSERRALKRMREDQERALKETRRRFWG